MTGGQVRCPPHGVPEGKLLPSTLSYKWDDAVVAAAIHIEDVAAAFETSLMESNAPSRGEVITCIRGGWRLSVAAKASELGGSVDQ